MRTLAAALLLSTCSFAQLISVGPGTVVRQGTRGEQIPPPPPPTGNGIIEGTVINEVTREPVKKAGVVLSGPVFLTAATDAAGHFKFTDLAPGEYTVQTQEPGRQQRPSATRLKQIHLGPDDHVSDVSLTTEPNGSVAGRVVDEEGEPMSYCNVALLHVSNRNGSKTLDQMGGANTNEAGEFEIDKVAPGKYYAGVDCPRQIPLPHPFMDRGSPEIPMLTYTPRFFPGSTDIAGATQIRVTPGANVSGIDFRMAPGQGVTVQGRITGSDLSRTSVMLERSGTMNGGWLTKGARVDPKSGAFQFRSVVPGSYRIVARTNGEERPWYASVQLEVGATAPDPVEIALAPLPSISGSVTVEGETTQSLEGQRVFVIPATGSAMPGPETAILSKDGTFTIPAVQPGRSRFAMASPIGFVKSVMLNDHEVSPDAFDVAGSGATLKVVVSTKWAQIEGSIEGAAQGGAMVGGILWRDKPQVSDSFFDPGGRPFNGNAQGHFAIQNIAPGHYRACAIADPMPWVVLQNPDLMEKIKPRCIEVDVDEGAHATIQVPLISSDDLQKMAAELDQ